MTKIKQLSIYLALGCITTFTASANAACTRADYTGTWRLYFPHTICKLIIPTTGSTISATSSCIFFGIKSSYPISGTLTMRPTCQITGLVKGIFGTDSSLYNVDAWVSKGKDSISGASWISEGEERNFSGVKQ